METAKKIAWPVLFLIGILAVWWWKENRNPAAARSRGSVASQGALSKSPAAARQPTTEGRWLVDEVTRDIAEMVLFAVDRKADPAKDLEVSVSATKDIAVYELAAKGPQGEVAHTLELKHHVWSPTDHAAWAAALLKAWQPPKSEGNAPEAIALIRNLTEPTTENIIREERRLSGLLNQQPLDADLHEQAALVVATFGLRETAGNNFTDTRPALCRSAAHLALARALRPEPSTCGQLAEAAQLTLANRQAEALEKIAKLPSGFDPWITSLKMRNTGDWRLCSQPAKATLLEQITWARTVAHVVNPTPLQEFLEEDDPADVPDWSRAVFGRGFGVEEGHVFATDALEKEYKDIAAAWKAWSGKALKDDELIKLLNEPARRAIVKSSKGFELAVLDWGQIAAQQQRHLCNAAYFADYFLRDLWGVPEEAERMEREIHGKLSGLRQYPFLVRCMMCSAAGDYISDEVFNKAMRGAAELCKQQPQIVSTANWSLLTMNCGRVMPALPPSAYGWFKPTLPLGTAFDFEHRVNDLRLPPDGPDFWTRCVSIAPYDFDVIRTSIPNTPNDLSPVERDIQEYKTISDFHLRAMRQIAKNVEHDAKAYATAMRPACELDPDLFVTLGNHLVKAGLTEEAAQAFETAFERAPDRVAFSNNCGWLVNYYYEKNRLQDAMKVAKDAAETYSYRGLAVAAGLLERMEEWESAARHYAAIAERYGSPGPLLGFLARNRGRDAKLDEYFNKIVKSQFPEGMKKVTLADFKEAPKSGAQITSDSGATQQWGLKSGDVIVALDGVRIESYAQYDLVRDLRPGTEPLALIVWDGAQYKELSAAVDGRRFGCDMGTYRK